MADLDLLRRFSEQQMPVKLVSAEEFKGAKELAALGYIKLAMPPMHNGREKYGHQDDVLVLAISPAGKRALLG